LAKKLQSYSTVFIFNAYDGEPIEKIIGGTFGTWDNGIQKLAQLSELPMPVVTSHIYSQVDKDVKPILDATIGLPKYIPLEEPSFVLYLTKVI
jgi:hypothetical protein